LHCGWAMWKRKLRWKGTSGGGATRTPYAFPKSMRHSGRHPRKGGQGPIEGRLNEWKLTARIPARGRRRRERRRPKEEKKGHLRRVDFKEGGKNVFVARWEKESVSILKKVSKGGRLPRALPGGVLSGNLGHVGRNEACALKSRRREGRGRKKHNEGEKKERKDRYVLEGKVDLAERSRGRGVY